MSAPPSDLETAPVVLLVDDDSGSLSLMAAHLNRHHIKTLSARNGKEALEVLRREPSVAIVVTDLAMPEMDGLELLRHIRQATSFGAISVILCSGNDSSEMMRSVSTYGGTRYLVKPIHAEYLLEQVLDVLGSPFPALT